MKIQNEISAFDITRHEGNRLYMVCFSLLKGPVRVDFVKEAIEDIPEDLELVCIRLEPDRLKRPDKNEEYGKDLCLYFAKVKDEKEAR